MITAWRGRLMTLAPALGAVFLLAYDPAGGGPTVCPFALLTGTACPGCGMTRAAAYLVRGDVGAAITLHPLVLLIATQMLAGWGWFMLRRSGRVAPMSTRITNAILIGTGVSLVGLWLVRAWLGALPPV